MTNEGLEQSEAVEMIRSLATRIEKLDLGEWLNLASLLQLKPIATIVEMVTYGANENTRQYLKDTATLGMVLTIQLMPEGRLPKEEEDEEYDDDDWEENDWHEEDEDGDWEDLGGEG